MCWDILNYSLQFYYQLLVLPHGKSNSYVDDSIICARLFLFLSPLIFQGYQLMLPPAAAASAAMGAAAASAASAAAIVAAAAAAAAALIPTVNTDAAVTAVTDAAANAVAGAAATCCNCCTLTKNPIYHKKTT